MEYWSTAKYQIARSNLQCSGVRFQLSGKKNYSSKICTLIKTET